MTYNFPLLRTFVIQGLLTPKLLDIYASFLPNRNKYCSHPATTITVTIWSVHRSEKGRHAIRYNEHILLETFPATLKRMGNIVG